VKALKDTVAQLRATTNKLSDNFAALKTSVATASTQNGKIAEALERIEKSQAEQRKSVTAASASTTEVTGSIAQQKQAEAPVVLGSPPTTLKPPAVPGFVLRRVYDGAALIEGRDGMIEVEPGMVAPGLGRVEAIKREDGRWVVVTARGIVR
jgi:septal ring factor EnvC (AmiA/AmiB activator)